MGKSGTNTEQVLLELSIPREVYNRLSDEAQRQHTTLNTLVMTYIEEHIDEAEVDSPEAIAKFQQAWHEAMTGQTVDLDELLSDEEVPTDGTHS